MDLHLLKHPFYQDWMAGKISRENLQDYAIQYYYHVDRFPRYLSALHSICETPHLRRDILQNLNDEEGTDHSFSHPELWVHFAEGLGVPKEHVLNGAPRAAIKNVTDLFFQYTRKSFHEGLGALLAYESQVPEIAASKIEGLKNQYNIHNEKTLAFFEIHKTADIEHREVLSRMIEELPAEQKVEAQVAFQNIAQALWDFLTDVHQVKASA